MIKLTFKGADTLGKTNESCAAAVLVRAHDHSARVETLWMNFGAAEI